MNTNLRWSRFNFLVRTTDQNTWLYNSYANSLIKIDETLFDNFRKLEAVQSITNDDLREFTKEEIDYFKSNYIFTEDDDVLVEILHMHSMSRLFSHKTLVLTIAPTQSCNFACTYCFEKWRQSAAMTDTTEDSIIRYIQNERDKNALETVNITWYGGEPLLQSKRIMSLAIKIRQLGLKIDENLLITNGYFFTQEIVKGLYESGIDKVQITLDGFRETHDLRRPLANGQGTFDAIIRNLDQHFTGKYSDRFDIAIRVNIDSNNYRDFAYVYKWLKDRYKSNRLIVYPGIIVLDENDGNFSTCLSRNNVTDIFFDLFRTHGIIPENFYPDDINIECMTRSPYNCMLIGSKGEIYKCYEDLGNKDLVVGNINDPAVWSNYELISKYATGIDHYNDPVCRKCAYLPICRGGCPIRRLENVYMNKHNDCCTPFKGRIHDYVELYSEIISHKH